MKRKTYDYQYQDVWRERALDDRFTLVWRLAALAFGYHRRNGHATFAPGQIARILGLSATHLSNLLAEAKELGLIDSRSCSRCLIVPPHAVNYGPGSPYELCGYCDGKLTGKAPKKAQNRRGAFQRLDTPGQPGLATPVDLDAALTHSSGGV